MGVAPQLAPVPASGEASRMRASSSISIACVLGLLASSPAAALSLSESDGVATLRGSIEPGDADILRAFLARPRATPLRVIWLSSAGGALQEGMEMARELRKARIATAVDATGAYCDSACTFLFVAGAQRHYVGGEKIIEGLSGLTGLGFHVSYVRDYRTRIGLRSEDGTQKMIDYYRELGAPRAAELAQKGMINSIYRPNGETALKLGVATSLSPP